MSRDLFRTELGFATDDLNGNTLTHDLSGAAAPGGDAGLQDAAPIGSTYKRTTGALYIKTANAGAPSDWTQVVTSALDSVQVTQDGITAAATVDTVLVDNYAAVEWELYIRDNANPDNVKVLKVYATHDGTSSADAANVDDTAYAKLKIGANFNVSVAVVLAGTGGTQTIGLQITSSETNGVDIRARRNGITF